MRRNVGGGSGAGEKREKHDVSEGVGSFFCVILGDSACIVFVNTSRGVGWILAPTNQESHVRNCASAGET